ncbi:MAG: hypothetical protein V4732_12115 [Pseudomonadota bacterium]
MFKELIEAIMLAHDYRDAEAILRGNLIAESPQVARLAEADDSI